jgi:hypothetical protein
MTHLREICGSIGLEAASENTRVSEQEQRFERLLLESAVRTTGSKA